MRLATGLLARLSASPPPPADHYRNFKVYLETRRDTLLVDTDTLEKARAFFADRGIRTFGGITWRREAPAGHVAVTIPAHSFAAFVTR
jgi:hypothetical protein